MRPVALALDQYRTAPRLGPTVRSQLLTYIDIERERETN